MKFIITILSILFSISSFSETVEINGKTHSVNTRFKAISCGNFSIESVTKKLPDYLHHSQIPKSLSIGHKGINYIGYELTFRSKDKEVDIKPLKDHLSGYQKLAKDRLYISRPIKCIKPNSVLFSMWGGGNCSDVCEAFSVISFDLNGIVTKARGLSVKEFNELKNN